MAGEIKHKKHVDLTAVVNAHWPLQALDGLAKGLRLAGRSSLDTTTLALAASTVAGSVLAHSGMAKSVKTIRMKMIRLTELGITLGELESAVDTAIRDDQAAMAKSAAGLDPADVMRQNRVLKNGMRRLAR